MSKGLITLGMAVLMCAGNAYATQSRLNSMGATSGGVKNFTIEDERNVLVLPAELVKYMRKAGIEIGGPGFTGEPGSGFTSFFIHYDLSPTMVIGVYGSNEPRSAVTLPGVNQAFIPASCKGGVANAENNGCSPPASDPDGDPEGEWIPQDNFANTGDLGSTFKAGVLFGMALDTTRLGFKLGVWGDSKSTTTFGETSDTVSTQGPLVIDIGLGAGFIVGDGDLDLGLNIKYGLPTDQDVDGDLSANSQFDIDLVARGTFVFSGRHEIVPYLTFGYKSANGQKFEVEEDPANPGNFISVDSPLHTGTDMRVTLGTDIRLKMDNVTVQPGLGLAYGMSSLTVTGDPNALDTQNNDQTLVMPFYNLAVEVKLFELGSKGYVDLRFGGGQAIIFNSTENYVDADLDSISSESDVQYHIATGVGIHYNGMHLDIQVNNGWWKNGPYFLTGAAGDGFGVNAALSIDY